ncbi:NTE family protein [Mycolicibacterium sp. BK556]|uniref:patatin-like phospholipase family protein n=1 Tax=Mycobacteriaceae TaxID=1762 RepID=UPI0010D21499|nr:patatin-like phospholipase family protein [Mycobacterium sp. BK086]MBB3605599.1 NTE family protein [Mycolicibacterium sp. BK556]MBB3635904.1 NTE family protein [Mycolicibacterium sp. BK607]MBB3753317.1 NTE family protein [Mycolicibacterium sp. BK634]TDO08920.1 NTE family protein [Mycobacterium sp. BK086]
MTTKRALILAGGGLAGIGWETGILRGIADEAPDTARALLASDVLVGTSAGSTVAAQISSPLSLEELFDIQTGDTSSEIESGADFDAITALFLSAVAQPGEVKEKLQRIGTVALNAPTVTEAARRKVIEGRLPSHDWPAQELRITAIDTATGDLRVFDSSSGVDLVDAVAASCAVPGTWPPVTIGGRRYMDGGVSSSVHTAVAEDCATAVVLVPASESTPSPFSSGTAAEIAAFGARTFAVFADDASLAAFGPNLLDPRCRRPSAIAGRDQGRRVAAAVTEFLA